MSARLFVLDVFVDYIGNRALFEVYFLQTVHLKSNLALNKDEIEQAHH